MKVHSVSDFAGEPPIADFCVFVFCNTVRGTQEQQRKNKKILFVFTFLRHCAHQPYLLLCEEY